MTIELFGVPGSGKSNAAQSLSQQLGIPLISDGVGHKRLNAVLYGMANPRVGLLFIFLVGWQSLISQTPRLLSFRLGLVVQTFAMLRVAIRGSASSLVDEGLLQRLLTVYESRLTPKQAQGLVRLISPSYVIFADYHGMEFKRYDDPSHPRHCQGRDYLETWKAIVSHNAAVLKQAVKTTGIPWSDATAPNELELFLSAEKEAHDVF